MILQNPFNLEDFTIYISNLLPNFKLDKRPVDVGSTGFKEITRLGHDNCIETSVFVIRSNTKLNSRTSLSNNSFKIMKSYAIYSALIVYVNDDETIWRFSHLTTEIALINGKVVPTYSNPKRHSYILGTEVGLATARKYLEREGKIVDFDDLKWRFSVEVVNKDFYNAIATHFYKLVGLYNSDGNLIEQPVIKLPTKNSKNIDRQSYAVRLIGRIIFLWFLKNKKSPEGIALIPEGELGENDDFVDVLHSKLEPIFFELLNKPSSQRNRVFGSTDHNLIPYLNGGLFHAVEGDGGDHYDEKTLKSKVEIPDDWFKAFFETLKIYNFTIDENLENDVDLSIDPEMLGRVFENLLAEINPETGQAARKSTGSFYTPRSIVNYMVDQALAKYLEVNTNIKSSAILGLLDLSNSEQPLDSSISKNRTKLLESITNLKCLDPACGSGAFPISVLHKILWLVSKLDPDGTEFIDSLDFEGTENWLDRQKLDYLRKRKIIRDNLFGIDIQSVAVEIAKLRCFLTLIVDQEIDDQLPNRGVIPLPNLDFKFICADSLTPLDENKQLSFGDDPEFEKKLSQIRKRYFATSDEVKKSNLKQKYLDLVAPEAQLFEKSNRNNQLMSFRPFENNSQATFFDPHTMFGVDSFNFIIGNPPYLVLRDKIYKPLVQHLKSIPSYTYAQGGNLNLYRHFIERSIRLLGIHGVMSFIVPSTLIADKSSSGIRRMIAEKSEIQFLAEFPEDSKIFESVTQATTIFLLERVDHPDQSRQFWISIGNNNSTLPPSQKVDVTWEFIKRIAGEDLSLPLISSELELKLIDSIASAKPLLDKYIRVYSGDADQTKQAEFISNTKQNHLFIAGNHVSHFKVDLSFKNPTKRWFKYTKSHSYELPERIVIQGIANMAQRIRIKGSIIPAGIVVGNSANCVELLSNEYSYEYILGLLSSELANWYFRKFSTNNNVNAYEVLAIPFAEPTKTQASKVERIVEKLMDLHSNEEPEADKVEKTINDLNLLIFDVYGLSQEERNLVEAT
jgi:Alw26I/Eco31I/Esp3I family type II restriction m6 adenine DNA methyltransferase